MLDFRKSFIDTAITHLWNYKLNRLTEWEREEFLPSVRNLWLRGYELSQKQYNTLQEIYQKYK